MRLTLSLIGGVLLAWTIHAGAETPRGKITGGQAHEFPAWFKTSFLDFNDELAEARKTGRHILVFVNLNDCPYCARVLDENFRQGDNMEYIKSHFDVIAMNIRGSEEVTWIDKAQYTERELAARLKVHATPALVFISPEGRQVLLLHGYRTPGTLRHALEYVHNRAYRNQSLAAYVEQRPPAAVYAFRNHPRFDNVTDLSHASGPIAAIFEDRNCADCDGFHDKVLSHPDVLAELKPFRVVRLDAYSNQAIVDISGSRTTPRAWAATLGINHRPGIVLFNEGRETARLEGRFYHFHFKELLRYVSGKHYRRHDRFTGYLAERQEQLLREGAHINLAE